MGGLVTLTRSDRVAIITLCRPDKLNAITIALRDELLDKLEEVAADPGIGCVVLEAEGRCFSAGQDLDERAPIAAGTPIDLGAALEAGINRIILALASLPQPVIAAVQGKAIGAGAGLALACDLVVAGPEACFHFTFARLGLVPDSGTSWFLHRRLGAGRAAQALYLSQPIDARRALDWGLVAEIAADEEGPGKRARELAQEIAARPSEAIRATKTLLRQALENDLTAQLHAEAARQTIAGHSDSYREALKAFFARQR